MGWCVFDHLGNVERCKLGAGVLDRLVIVGCHAIQRYQVETATASATASARVRLSDRQSQLHIAVIAADLGV